MEDILAMVPTEEPEFWENDEILLVLNFLHCSRAGGCFYGPVQEATWDHIATKMNSESAIRGINIRVYTARNVAFAYLSQIKPLLRIPIHTNGSNVPFLRNCWSIDEDDLLLHFLSAEYPGGRFTGHPEEGNFQRVAENMNATAPLFGINIRTYSMPRVQDRYRDVLFQRETGIPCMHQNRWEPREDELLLQLSHVTWGGKSNTEWLSHEMIAEKMNAEMAKRGIALRTYTQSSISGRIRFLNQLKMHMEFNADGQLMPAADADFFNHGEEDPEDDERYLYSDEADTIDPR